MQPFSVPGGEISKMNVSKRRRKAAAAKKFFI
jgi:hypothetical protein